MFLSRIIPIWAYSSNKLQVNLDEKNHKELSDSTIRIFFVILYSYRNFHNLSKQNTYETNSR